MKRYELAEENGSFVLLELRPVPVATFAERALAELVLDLLEEAAEDDETLGPRTARDKRAELIRHMTDNSVVVRKMSDEENASPPPMSEAVVIVPADHETETGAAPEGEAPGGGEEAPRLSAAPAEAEAAEAGPSAPPADEPPSWEKLHALGLTAREAAEARDCHVNAAYMWSSKNGVKWAPASPAALDPAAKPAPAPRPAADLKGWTQEDLDAALLQVEGGGKVEAVADEFGKPAHVLKSHWMKRLAAKREAAGLPLRTNGATAREDAEAGR